MKVNIEVDCTPDEARRFLGLPDVAPMQQTRDRGDGEAAGRRDHHAPMPRS